MDSRNMNEYTVEQLMPASPQLMDYSFTGSYTDTQGAQHNVTVFSNDYFFYNALQYYAKRQIMLPGDLSNAMGYFHDLFYQWKNSRSQLYCKQAYAYTLAYNPIENYSSTEQLIDDTTEHEKGASNKVDYHNKDEDELTPFTKITNETTPYTKEETTTTPYTKEETTNTGVTSGVPSSSTTNSRMAFNSGDFVGTDKSETDTNSKTEFKKTGTEKVELKKSGTEKVETTYQGKEKHVIEHTGYVETTTDGTDTDTRNYTLKKSGNIGVQTASQMLELEFKGLSQDLAFRALAEFFDRYTYYNVALEGWW